MFLKNLQLRAEIIQALRNFFIKKNYLEIETPYRIPAPAPEANIDAVSSETWFLHTSPELCMKRLLAAGFSRIFQICKCFRRGERGNRHLPEFTILEWYEAGFDYMDMMEQCEELICSAACDIGFGSSFFFQGQNIDLKRPWDRITVAEAFKRFSPVSMENALVSGSFDEMIGIEIEPHLGKEKPVFLYDYPASCGALAKLKPDKSAAERFELYISGMELCNAFTELTDCKEQRKRFNKEQEMRGASGKKEYPIPEKFLNDLEFMPDASGNALGIDRLVMLFADTVKIDDVVAFVPENL
ncbi:EF-P lysine aminoacylase EpmA [Desulfonema limicola]|uniref:EF-P lysine aminoacylase EpmA n=1 Tax=Desulfonema limicola TaxID=45656 RepID=UPI001FE2D7BF|nr:EF-P lysine aminoacylase EpmA [Desulfonema limicola]